jgi:probable HAF family extracellular repeat protein
MTDLGTLGGDYARAEAINERGQVVGQSWTLSGETHGFVWEDGTMTDLGDIGTQGRLISINEDGQVLGNRSATGPDVQAFIWHDGVMTDVRTAGGARSSFGHALNESGQVVGQSWTAGGSDFQAFLWDDGTLTDLGARETPWDINDTGLIVGGGPPAFVWQDGIIIELATLGGASMALDVNEAGTVVGVSPDPSGLEHAVLWTSPRSAALPALTSTGWPTVERAGVTMTGAVDDAATPDPRLPLSITLTGLAPGEAASLRAVTTYHLVWACGVAPEPCGELGCGPANWNETTGTATTAARVAAGRDGTATARIELVADPPAEPCPADSTVPWRTLSERWESVRIADPAHGLLLTPDPVERAITF